MSKLDEFHWHEVMDRTDMIASMVDDFLAAHPAIQSNPELVSQVESVGSDLGHLYQMASQKSMGE
mgnify:CR=1 FL=1